MWLVITHAILVEQTAIAALIPIAVFFARILIKTLMDFVSAVKVWAIFMMIFWTHVSNV